MPFQPKTKGKNWRHFFPDGSGAPDLVHHVRARGAYSFRAIQAETLKGAHEQKPDGRYSRPAGADEHGGGESWMGEVAPSTFVRSSHVRFEWAIYLALTAPLRELGA